MQTTEVLNEIKQNLIEETSITVKGKIYSSEIGTGYVPSKEYLAKLADYQKPFDSILVFQTQELKIQALSWYDNTIVLAREVLKAVYGWGMRFSDAVVMDLKRKMDLILIKAKISIQQMIEDLRVYLKWGFYTVSVSTGEVLQPENIYQAWLMRGNVKTRALKDVLFNRN